MQDMAQALDALNQQLSTAGCRAAEVAAAVSRLTELLEQEYRRPARVRQARRGVTAPPFSVPSAEGMGTSQQSASSPSPPPVPTPAPSSRSAQSTSPSEDAYNVDFYAPEPVSAPGLEGARQPDSPPRKIVPALDPLAEVFLDTRASIEHLVKEYEVPLRQRPQTAHNVIARLLSHMICCRRALTPSCQSRAPKPSR